VQQRGSFWIIERSRLLKCGHTRDETLVCAPSAQGPFGRLPVRRRCDWLSIAIRCPLTGGGMLDHRGQHQSVLAGQSLPSD
jgi:hypothetical protein